VREERPRERSSLKRTKRDPKPIQDTKQHEDNRPQIQDDLPIDVEGILIVSNDQDQSKGGYLADPKEDYVRQASSIRVERQTIKKWSLRSGSLVKGQARFNGSGQYELFNVTQVDGMDPNERSMIWLFEKFEPDFPDKRIFLENQDHRDMTSSIVELVTPIGRGQRGLIVAPPRVGKTMMLQSLANSIISTNPDMKMIILLIDERPEEVTDMKRSVPKAEVFSSTFDEDPRRHVKVAEAVIDRAKRLVECGNDVIILLDSITRLARAYNTIQPKSGRVLSGGVEADALRGPKKFFGAARNIKNLGSLTILATALIDTGSKMDDVIFEEFKGTGNMELHLSRELADQRVYPAIDIKSSGTRKEELLTDPKELELLWHLRRKLSTMNPTEGMKRLKDEVSKSPSNALFLMKLKTEFDKFKSF